MKKIVGIVIAVIVLAVIIILVASGKTNAPQVSPSPSPRASVSPTPETSSTPTPAPAAAATSTVTITNFAFSPANITVTKGTTVTWTNKDVTAHTVTSSDGKNGPKSGELNQNQSYKFTFNEVGSFEYNCSLHPYMTGTVTVTE